MTDEERLELRERLKALSARDLLKAYGQYNERFANCISGEIGYLAKAVVMIETEIISRMEGNQ